MQTFVNDPYIHSKLNLNFPVKFVVHGWLGGLFGMNRWIELEKSEGKPLLHMKLDIHFQRQGIFIFVHRMDA